MSEKKLTFSYKKYIIYTLGIIFAALVVTYGIFLQSTVDNVVERSNLEKKIADVRSDIGSAEETFGSYVGSATLQKANELGFERTEGMRFVTRSIDSNTVASVNAQN